MPSPKPSALKSSQHVSQPTAAQQKVAARAPSLRPDVKNRLNFSTLKTESLAYALLGAGQAIAMVRDGASLPQALSQVFAQSAAPAATRGAIQDIAYRTMRSVGLAEVLIAALTSKAPEPSLLHGVLCCALSLLAEVDKPAYDQFTVVDQAVTATASDLNIAHAKGMVNAVLRRFLREREALTADANQNPLALWNYPVWWIDQMQAAYPQDWQAILTRGNQPPPLTLRVNQRKISVPKYLQLLAENSIAARQIGPVAVRLEKPLPVNQIPGFEAGLVSVQDAAAQLAAPLLDLQDGMRVLDACAAPGGKTCHLLELADVTVTALDHDAKRLQRIAQNLQRLQLNATLQVGDARLGANSGSTESIANGWWDGQLFDRILADVPCTASGIVRRHPDIRWLRRATDTDQLATLSADILDNLWQMLRPDGKLLLVTCSLWPQESEQQAVAFAQRNQAIRLTAPGQLIPTTGDEHDHDGLFYALFQKT
ncbi:16S rRNA (cytosine(967)-C(5))-methyltransferase RsmB [Glaciimonas sp. PAMC28666]|uniref:16S rRNA (cytosine(967)-C(5))-methyltransferase RsmB n=1 Tax=Glaciimonas sp. PAMC28666 TaxID=2807626 RepID=UPI0019653CEB|nr:16S rRNA (cytosine(967)-C(5))-methyltransferase RsmB [Glaciimonas sp. PAMC28666]QRX84809.1 16S rRNA (cytosine(967)-C(5))-methyltransferase RsmB [Glaciimonas sp. PAMC28666]